MGSLRPSAAEVRFRKISFLMNSTCSKVRCSEGRILMGKNVFLRRSYNKIVINFEGNEKTIGPQVFRFLADC